MIDCRFCGGSRPDNGTVCLGCGMPVQNAINRTRPPRRMVVCPGCHSQKVRSRSDGTFECVSCGAWFDNDDEGIVAVDTRPVENAEKRERRKVRRWRR